MTRTSYFPNLDLDDVTFGGDGLSDGRLCPNGEVYLTGADGEYLHAVLDIDTTDTAYRLTKVPMFTASEKASIMRTLYAHDEFVNFEGK